MSFVFVQSGVEKIMFILCEDTLSFQAPLRRWAQRH